MTISASEIAARPAHPSAQTAAQTADGHPAPISAEDVPVTLADIKAAAMRIAGAVVRTPTLKSQTLSHLIGTEIWLKFENLQFTAAYKERGALNKLRLLGAVARDHGVIAASAGNHAQGLAYHGRRLGVPITIVMPETTPLAKVMPTEAHGATVILHGTNFDEANAHARALEAERGLIFVPAFDDADVVAGQGTVALEMLADVPDLDTLVVPIGGGGLISGIAVAAKAINPDIRILGVQAELYPSMFAAIKGLNMPCGGETLAEGIAVKEPGRLTRALVAEWVDDIVLVSESDLERAVCLLLQIEKTLVEGAGAAGLAALGAYPDRFRGRKVGLVLCGGNIDTRLLANVLMRDLVRSRRLARLSVRMRDQPGALFEVARIFHEFKVNILEVHHQRIFTTLPAKGLITEIECETRDAAHLDRLIAGLGAAGYEVSLKELEQN